MFIIAGLTTASIVYRLVVGLAGWPIERIYYAADTRSDELLAGCLLALLIARCRLPVRDIYAIPAGALLMAFVVLPTSWTSVFYRDGGSFAIALASAAIVAILVQRPEGSVAHILRFRPLVWIGRRSYGMYLWNLPLAAMVGFVLPGSVLTTLLVLALSVLVPALSYRFVEQPFLILKTRATKARSLPVRTAICSEPASSLKVRQARNDRVRRAEGLPKDEQRIAVPVMVDASASWGGCRTIFGGTSEHSTLATSHVAM